VFRHKRAAGSADKSYGIHVAQRAGVPAEVLTRAREVLAELEAHHLKASEGPAGARIRRPKVVQPSLFANSEDPILQELRALDAAKLTPEEVAATQAEAAGLPQVVQAPAIHREQGGSSIPSMAGNPGLQAPGATPAGVGGKQ